MGGNMRDKVVKTAYLRRLDQVTELRKAFDLDQVVAAFEDDRISMPELARQFGIIIDERSEEHVREDWLNTSGKGWFRNPHNNDILRKAFTEAVIQVRKRDIPIDAYWVCALPPGKPWEVYQAVNDRQLTLIILTPFPDLSESAVPSDRIESTTTDPLIQVTKWDDDRNCVVHVPTEE